MLEYAFKKNKEDNLIYISEVKSGLDCDCVCPSCKKILIAKKGKEKAHHFAHHKIADCGYGLQTALHIKAKEILEKYKIFKIPPLIAKYKDITKQIANEITVEFDSVKLETRQGEIIPDVIGVVKGHKIFIEIFVTHKVGDKKKDYIRNKKNISCIEIDLSNLYKDDKNIEQQDLKEKIINNIENKKWIHNVYYKDAEKEAKEEWLEEEKAHLKWLENEEKAKEKQKKKRLETEKKIEIENKKNYVKKHPSYYVEIDDISKDKEKDVLSAYEDSYKGFKIVGKVVNNKKITFEAECNIRADDGENLLIISIKSKKNNGNSFYEEINSTEKEFNFVISNKIPFPL
jgi:hypothetical protein